VYCGTPSKLQGRLTSLSCIVIPKVPELSQGFRTGTNSLGEMMATSLYL